MVGCRRGCGLIGRTDGEKYKFGVPDHALDRTGFSGTCKDLTLQKFPGFHENKPLFAKRLGHFFDLIEGRVQAH